jgi:hypothetical protein
MLHKTVDKGWRVLVQPDPPAPAFAQIPSSGGIGGGVHAGLGGGFSG